MKKLTLSFLIVGLLMVSFAYGVAEDDADLIVWYKLDGASVTMPSEVGIGLHCDYDGVGQQDTAVAVGSTFSVNFDDDICNSTAVIPIMSAERETISVVWWSSTTDWGSRSYTWAFTGGEYFFFTDNAPHIKTLVETNTGNEEVEVVGGFFGGQMFVSMVNNSHLSLYSNNTMIGTNDFTGQTVNAFSGTFQIGALGGEQQNGKIDEFMVFKRALSYEDINDLWTVGLTAPTGDTTPPEFNVTSINDSVNETFNTPIWINITSNEAGNCSVNDTDWNLDQHTNLTYSYLETTAPDQFFHILVNCTDESDNVNETVIFFSKDTKIRFNVTSINNTYNDTFNYDIWINVSMDEIGNCTTNNTEWNLNSSTNLTYSFLETNAPDGFYAVDVICNDTLGNENNTIIFFSKDISIPTIEMGNPLSDNSSVIFNTGSIDLNATFRDNLDLWVYNITIFRSGTAIQVYNKSGMISGSVFDYSEINLDTSGFLNLTYDMNIRLCDSHTLSNIPDATSVAKFNTSLLYQFDDIWIRIKSINGNELSTNSIKSRDRYSSEFNYDKPTVNKVFEITTDGSLYYLPQSKFKGHFIINNKLWVDFENDENANVLVVKSDDGYMIYVDSTAKTIKFNSIGFLNCIDRSYSFILSPDAVSDNPYNIGLFAGNFFNTEALDTSTTSGVMLFFFMLAVLIVMLIFGEVSGIPAVMFLSAIFGFFLGILFFVSLSVVMGILFIALSSLYMFRSITFTNS